MPTIALLARECQHAVFWGPAIARLKSAHDFTFRVIDRTPSVPGDMTFSALPLSMILASNESLTSDQLKRIETLLQKQRSVAIVVASKGTRAWERVQLQVTMEKLPVMIIPGLSPSNAADAMAAFVRGFTTCQVPPLPGSMYPASLLTSLELNDAKLQLLLDKTERLSNLVDIVQPANRSVWEAELGKDVVDAIEAFLTHDDSY